MRTLLAIVNVFNFFVLLTLLASLSVIFLKFTFTVDNDLPDDNIPYYISDDPGNDTEGDSARFGLYWWVYATDSLRILVPFLLLVNILVLKYGGPGFTVVVQFLLALLFLWEIAKFIWAVILWADKNCANHQFCRNLGARRDGLGEEIGDDPNSQSGTYSFYVWYSLAFIFISAFALVLVGSMEGALLRWARLQNIMRGTKEKGDVVGAPDASTAWWILGLTTLFVAVLVVYLPLVFLNFTFTNGNVSNTPQPLSDQFNLPDDRVPFYISDNPADPTELDSGKFELYWWIYASDTLLILAPLAALANANAKAYRGANSGFTLLLQIFLALLLLWQIVKFVWAGVLAVPTVCETHQFCRAFGSRRTGMAETGANARNLNFVYSSYLWFSLGFAILLIALLFLVTSMRGAYARSMVAQWTSGTPRTNTTKKKNKNKKKKTTTPPTATNRLLHHSRASPKRNGGRTAK